MSISFQVLGTTAPNTILQQLLGLGRGTILPYLGKRKVSKGQASQEKNQLWLACLHFPVPQCHPGILMSLPWPSTYRKPLCEAHMVLQ